VKAHGDFVILKCEVFFQKNYTTGSEWRRFDNYRRRSFSFVCVPPAIGEKTHVRLKCKDDVCTSCRRVSRKVYILNPTAAKCCTLS